MGLKTRPPPPLPRKKNPQLSLSTFSPNVRIGSQNYLTISFNPFATLLSNFKFIAGASPKLLHLNQENLSKKSYFFLVKSLKL